MVSRLAKANLERALVESARAHPVQQERGNHVVLGHLGIGEREVVRGDRRSVAPAGVPAEA